MAEGKGDSGWIGRLSDEDLAFVKRFVLASGSLKALAEAYGVSYPTIRLRLDRLIEKIRIIDDMEIADELERQARMLMADGKIDGQTLRALLAAHRKDLENDRANRGDNA
ncbi:MAG TPA: DUF2089 family protein [Phycisphaerae bacterium]|nr:DUF2089 family protein [Phycisphaerae bacterium]